MNIVELCAAHNLNPKVVRAKLRRAVKDGKLAIEHEHRGPWHATAAVIKFLGLKEKPAKAPKKPRAKKEQESAAA